MENLKPLQAARIANAVYDVRENLDIAEAMKMSDTENLGLGNEFVPAQNKAFQGKSGWLVFKSRTGFGYIAEGQGIRSGEMLIATRGTVSLNDWCTDGNFALSRGPSGWPVHSGFNQTFESFRPVISSYLSSRGEKPKKVHCVGHSLGGALSTLCADLLSQQGIDCSLYTFGCPRTGLEGFGRNLTRKLKPQNIYRVYHTADPVPMIPIFPYLHVPMANTHNYRLEWPGFPISVPAHFMDGYIKSIGNADWNTLHKHVRPDTEIIVQDWLQSASTGGFLSNSASTFWMITRALAWIIKKVAINTLGLVLVAGATLLDQLSEMLVNGALASVEIAGYVTSLMGKILRFIGHPIVVAKDLTVKFVRWVLSLLVKTVTNVAAQSMEMLKAR